MNPQPVRSAQAMPYGLVQRILNLPRIARVLLCGFFSLAVTIALSPMVDEIYVRFFFSSQTVIIPSLISAAFGLVMYMLGWWLVIGTVGEKPPARLGVLWYFGVGVLAIIAVIFLIIRGITLLNIAASPL